MKLRVHWIFLCGSLIFFSSFLIYMCEDLCLPFLIKPLLLLCTHRLGFLISSLALFEGFKIELPILK